MSRHTGRILFSEKNTSRNVLDANTNQRPYWVRGDDFELEFALENQDGSFVTASQVGSIEIVVRAANDSESEPKRMTKMIGAGACDAGFSAGQWQTGGSLAVATWTAAEAALEVPEGKGSQLYYIYAVHTSPSGYKTTYGSYVIYVRKAPHATPTLAAPDPPEEMPMTVSQGDARYPLAADTYSKGEVDSLVGENVVFAESVLDAAIYEGTRIKREPHQAPVFSAPLGCEHYFPFDSLTDLVTGTDLVLGSVVEDYALSSHGIGFNKRDQSNVITFNSVTLDLSGDWTFLQRWRPTTSSQADKQVWNIWNASNQRAMKLVWDSGQFKVHVSADGTTGGVTIYSGSSNRLFVAGVEHVIELRHTAAGALTLVVNGITEIDETGVAIYNATDKTLLMVAQGVYDECYIFNTATPVETTYPEIWNDGMFRATDWSRNFKAGFSIDSPPHIFLMLGQSNRGGFNVAYSNETSHYFPEYRAKMAWHREDGSSNTPWEMNDLVPVGPFSRNVANSVGSQVPGMAVGDEVGMAHALLERGFEQLYFLNYSKGGAGVVNGVGPKDWSETGDMWVDGKAWINARLADITTETGETAVPSYVVWFQGEAEALASRGADHKAAVLDLMARCRDEWGDDLKFIMALPWDENEDRPDMAKVRQNLIEIAAEDPIVYLIETKNLRRQDDVHVTPQGMLAFGRAAATFVRYPRIF